MQADRAERNKETVGSLLTRFCFSLSSRRKLFEESSLSKPSPIKSSPRRDARTVSSPTCFCRTGWHVEVSAPNSGSTILGSVLLKTVLPMSPMVQSEQMQTPNTSVSKRTVKIRRISHIEGCCQCNLFFKFIVRGKKKKQSASFSQSD